MLSPELKQKVDFYKSKRVAIRLGQISFDSPLLLAPMSAICHFPFRLLMQELGAGGTVSELISCHGINYGNEKTKQMLRIHPIERNIGIQLFGEDQLAMAKAAATAQEYGPKFIDINMGCPVRKVVSKGGGSALMRDTRKLAAFFREMKQAIEIPLTIKIRTGWDQESINAMEIVNIAEGEGVEFVAIHGRTRTQQYKGKADWKLLESIATEAPLPIIGNGDLHSAPLTQERMRKTNCEALMLGRGPLRDPFIFLTSYADNPHEEIFSPKDYWEITLVYLNLLREYTELERTHLIQMRKMIVWFVAGFDGVSEFRGKIFKAKELQEVLNITEDFLMGLEVEKRKKNLDLNRPFMMGGHG